MNPELPKTRSTALRTGWLAAVALLLPLAFPALADRVLLTNGEAFEDVLVVEAGEQIRIRLEGGEMRLSKSQVQSIEKAGSPFATFLERRGALEAAAEATAGDWVDLARWALARNLKHSARAAALEAARLDSRAGGLEPVLEGFGFVLDPDTETWMPLAQHMARRGLVLYGGEWMRREERESRLALRLAELEARRKAADDERRTRALERVAAAAATRQEPAQVVVLPMLASLPAPFFVVPSWPVVPGHPGGAAPVSAAAHPGPTLDLFERQPGSLIPGTLNLDAGRGGDGGRKGGGHRHGDRHPRR
jgi:endonuclease/exonuclease/phosphatase family metal-dependent hydrolase